MADPGEVFDLLADEYARDILKHASRKPLTVAELAEACDAHHSTIYRRIEQLQEFDLMSEQVRVDSEGHHATEYVTQFHQLVVTLEEHDYDVDLRVKADAADKMAQMWRQIRGEE